MSWLWCNMCSWLLRTSSRTCRIYLPRILQLWRSLISKVTNSLPSSKDLSVRVGCYCVKELWYPVKTNVHFLGQVNRDLKVLLRTWAPQQPVVSGPRLFYFHSVMLWSLAYSTLKYSLQLVRFLIWGIKLVVLHSWSCICTMKRRIVILKTPACISGRPCILIKC